MIQVDGLTYRYPDGTLALYGLDCRVEAGEKVAIVGSNGAGKSTLLELLAGFHFPFEGSVRVLGEPLAKETAAGIRRHLGLVFQDPDDQVFMPRVWDDVAFGPRNLGWPPEQVSSAVEAALKEFRIEDLADRAPHRLSYGQRKRVAITGVLAMRPEILLLDEPLAGLDHRTRSDLLRKLAAIEGTMLVTTHDVHGIVEFVDRVVVLHGTKVAEGAPRDILLRQDALAAADIETPVISRVLRILRDLGEPVEDLPLSLEGAIERLAERQLRR